MISSIINKLKSCRDWTLNDTPYLWRAIVDDPSVFVTWEEVEECLNNPQFYDLQFLDHSGRTVPIPAYRRPWGHEFTPEVKDVIDQFNHGHTVIINNFEYMRGKQELLNWVETYFANIRAAFHVYCGTETSRSFNIHEDDAHNFIVQIDGETQWTVYNHRKSELVSNHPPDIIHHDDLEVLIDTTLLPGDILYIPKHYYHRAQPRGKRLSLSIPMVCPEFAGPEMKYQDRKYYEIT